MHMMECAWFNLTILILHNTKRHAPASYAFIYAEFLIQPLAHHSIYDINFISNN